MNVGISAKNLMIGVFMKRVICGALVRVIASVIMHVKFTNIWMLKIDPVKNI